MRSIVAGMLTFLLVVVLCAGVVLAIMGTVWWRDRRAARRAKAAWEAWGAAHPRPPASERERLFQIREQLRLESEPAYIQASRYRHLLAEAKRDEQAKALLDLERFLDEGGPRENRLL
jgi:hypothetical protein